MPGGRLRRLGRRARGQRAGDHEADHGERRPSRPAVDRRPAADGVALMVVSPLSSVARQVVDPSPRRGPTLQTLENRSACPVRARPSSSGRRTVAPRLRARRRSRCMALIRSRAMLTNSPVASTVTTPSWSRRPVLKVRRSVTSVTHASNDRLDADQGGLAGSGWSGRPSARRASARTLAAVRTMSKARGDGRAVDAARAHPRSAAVNDGPPEGLGRVEPISMGGATGLQVPMTMSKGMAAVRVAEPRRARPMLGEPADRLGSRRRGRAASSSSASVVDPGGGLGQQPRAAASDVTVSSMSRRTAAASSSRPPPLQGVLPGPARGDSVGRRRRLSRWRRGSVTVAPEAVDEGGVGVEDGQDLGRAGPTAPAGRPRRCRGRRSGRAWPSVGHRAEGDHPDRVRVAPGLLEGPAQRGAGPRPGRSRRWASTRRRTRRWPRSRPASAPPPTQGGDPGLLHGLGRSSSTGRGRRTRRGTRPGRRATGPACTARAPGPRPVGRRSRRRGRPPRPGSSRSPIPKIDPAPAQVVEGGDLLGQHDRVVLGDQRPPRSRGRMRAVTDAAVARATNGSRLRL